MTDFETSLVLLGILLACLVSGIWIFVALMAASIITLMIAAGMSPGQVGSLLRATLWKSTTSWEMIAVPMFIFMGELFFVGGLSQDLFQALKRRFERLPGGLLHVNVWGSSLFAAISGSSTATMMTIGRVTVPQLRRLGYGAGISYGSLAGAGTLGILIPPSIPLIIYGILSEQSITKLFAAGVLPGLVVAGLFTAYIILVSMVPARFNRNAMPQSAVGVAPDAAEPKGTVVPTLIVVAIVFGGIYSGYVTATEAAVLGVTATLLICLWKRTLTVATVREALVASIGSSANILIIVACAAFLSAAVGAMGIPQYLIETIAAYDLSYAALILALALVFLILGMFIDGLSMMVITLPVVLPVVVAAGGDPIWFGIFLVLMIEIGLLTPPVGVHLFVMQSMCGRSLWWATRAAFPFTLLLAIATLIVALFPQISLLLPRLLY